MPPNWAALSTLALAGHAFAQVANVTSGLSWHPPSKSEIDDLGSIINKTGVYGFIFNSSMTPLSVPYSTYNWCNMPHVRRQEYVRANSSYKLEYVEVIHRHHKRTPYAANTFPIETYGWDCSDQGLFYSGAQLPVNSDNTSAQTYWSVFTSPSNPLRPAGFAGNCQFPQITSGGLRDSRQHGLDLASVYKDLLGFLPRKYDPKQISFRVSNNVITSQVSSALIPGYYPHLSSSVVPLLIQPPSVDSLEPAYSCPSASSLFSSYASGSTSGPWQSHLTISQTLFSSLDAISGVSPSTSAWHVSWDHYYDNLSARLCHGYPLPCAANSTARCVTPAQADAVFRLGQWEYSYTYRAAGPQALQASTASYGIWVAELADTLRAKAGLSANATSTTADRVKFRHNVAHDGSVSRLLAVLQLDRMVWPGMGAEVVFELFSRSDDAAAQPQPPLGGYGGYHGGGSGSGRAKRYFLRVLWGGQVLVSRNPALGRMDMLPVEAVLAYFDGLVGQGAKRVPGLCGLS